MSLGEARGRSARGQTAVEYAGVILLVAAIIASLVAADLGGRVNEVLDPAVDDVAEGSRPDGDSSGPEGSGPSGAETGSGDLSDPAVDQPTGIRFNRSPTSAGQTSPSDGTDQVSPFCGVFILLCPDVPAPTGTTACDSPNPPAPCLPQAPDSPNSSADPDFDGPDIEDLLADQDDWWREPGDEAACLAEFEGYGGHNPSTSEGPTPPIIQHNFDVESGDDYRAHAAVCASSYGMGMSRSTVEQRCALWGDAHCTAAVLQYHGMPEDRYEDVVGFYCYGPGDDFTGSGCDPGYAIADPVTDFFVIDLPLALGGSAVFRGGKLLFSGRGAAGAGAPGGVWRTMTTVDDVLANPQLLAGRTPAQVQASLLRSSGWRVETLGRGSHQGQGWVLREYTSAGNRTGRMIRWHPGGGHHGPNPYWRVSDGQTRSDIIPG